MRMTKSLLVLAMLLSCQLAISQIANWTDCYYQLSVNGQTCLPTTPTGTCTVGPFCEGTPITVQMYPIDIVASIAAGSNVPCNPTTSPSDDWGDVYANITHNGTVTNVPDGDIEYWEPLFTTYNFSAPGTYSIDMYYSFNNALKGRIQFEILPTPTFPSVPLMWCDDEPAQFIGSSSANGTFSGPGITSFTIWGNTYYMFNPATAGVGSHTITLSNGPCSVTETFTVNPAPNLPFLPTDFCVDDNTDYPIANMLYNLNCGGIIASGPGVSSTPPMTFTTYNFNPFDAGVGTHTLTWTCSATGCDSEMTVTVHPAPVLSLSTLPALDMCNDSEFCLDGLVTPAGGTYTLVSGTGSIGSASGCSNMLTLGPGMQYITYEYTNAFGCTEQLDFALNVNPGGSLWPRSSDQPQNLAQGEDIVTDNEGNVYGTGRFINEVKFDGITLTGTLNNRHETYVTKYNECGQIQWAARTRTNGSSDGVGISVDNDLELIYITGNVRANSIEFWNALDPSNNLVTGCAPMVSYLAGGYTQCYVASYTFDGCFVDVKFINPPSSSDRTIAGAVAVSNSTDPNFDGRVYLTYKTDYSSAGAGDLLNLQVLNSGLNTISQHKAWSPELVTPNDICVEGTEAYIVGHYQKMLDFGSPHTAVDQTTAGLTQDAFVVQFKDHLTSPRFTGARDFGVGVDSQFSTAEGIKVRDDISSYRNLIITGSFRKTISNPWGIPGTVMSPSGSNAQGYVAHIEVHPNTNDLTLISSGYNWINQYQSNLSDAMDLVTHDNDIIVFGNWGGADFDMWSSTTGTWTSVGTSPTIYHTFLTNLRVQDGALQWRNWSNNLNNRWVYGEAIAMSAAHPDNVFTTGYYDHEVGYVNNVSAIPTLVSSPFTSTNAFFWRHEAPSSSSGASNRIIADEVQNSEGTTFTVFPNPADNYFVIETSDYENTQFALVDLSGRVMASGMLNNVQTRVALDDVSTGMYQLILTNNGDKVSTKLIIE